MLSGHKSGGNEQMALEAAGRLWERQVQAVLERCKLKLLGRFTAQQADRDISRFRTHKTAALLARLAFYKDRPHPREELIDLLWPETEMELGRNNLSKALSSLRNQLTPPGAPLDAILLADRQNVQINPQAVETDIADFEAALHHAGMARTDSEKLATLRQAFDLYTGELLPGFYEDWTLLERERLQQDFLRAALSAIDLLSASRMSSEAIPIAQRALIVDPLSEETAVILMNLWNAQGQPGLALKVFHDLERRLRDYLAAEPGPVTLRTARQIAAQESAIEISERPGEDVPSQVPLTSRSAAEERRPTGTVTFLAMVREPPAPSALSEVLLTEWSRTVRTHGGGAIASAPDRLVAVFHGVGDALEAGIAAHRALSGPDDPTLSGAALRFAIHTGDIDAHAEDFEGEALAKTLRLAAAAHPRQILCSQATAGLVRAESALGVILKELGSFALSAACPASERLFQIDYRGASMPDFPPLAAEQARSRSLPLRFNRFFGREREITLLHDWLADSQVRVITLTGPGGAGKTRLALETGDSLPASDPRSIWFVALAESTTCAAILAAIRDTLKLSAGAGDPLTQIVARLADERALLILDNFEQVVDAGASLVHALIQALPRLTCLVTSRRILAIEGEHEFTVPPLAVPNAVSTPAQLTLVDSVRLFVDRAQTAKPDFQVTPHNASAVAELCARLEGIPLAIELAAARTMVLTPTQMVAQLQDRFTFLTSRRRDLVLRHRTLKAAIEWSYQLLPPELARFFTEVAVFRGSFSLAAAEAVAQEPLALDHLQNLRECSLLSIEEAADGEALALRFRMLDSLRDFALGQIGDEPLAALRRRHTDYYLSLAEGCAPKLRGAGQAVALAQLAQDHDNLRAALAYAESLPLAAAAQRLGVALASFWNTRGFLPEGREALARLLALESDNGSALRLPLLHWSGILAYSQGDFERSADFHTQALELAQGCGDTRWIAEEMLGQGWVEFEHGNYDRARPLFQSSLEIHRNAGNDWGIQSALLALGVIASNRAEYDLSESLFLQCIEIQQRLGDQQGVAACLNNLGIIARRRGDFGLARSRYEESLAIRLRSGDSRSIAAAYSNLGVVHLNQGDLLRAEDCFQKSLDLRRQIGDRWGTAISLSNLGLAAAQAGDLNVSEKYQRESLQLRALVGDRLGIAVCLESLAETAHLRGRYARAALLLGASSALRLAIQTPIPSSGLATHEQRVAEMTDRLGVDAYSRKFSIGAEWTLEQSIAFGVGTNEE